MSLYHGTKKILLPGKACHLFISLFSSFNLFAQETNSEASGRVYSESKEKVSGATVTLTHEPTQNTYSSVTGADCHVLKKVDTIYYGLF